MGLQATAVSWHLAALCQREATPLSSAVSKILRVPAGSVQGLWNLGGRGFVELCSWVRADVGPRPALPGGHCRQVWQAGEHCRIRYGWCWLTFLMFALCAFGWREGLSATVALQWPLGGCGTQRRALLEVDTGVSSIPVLTASQNG